MRLLRAADRIATPWKNGGGVTTEVAAFPDGATLADFGWRVSIAEVRQGGPFSVFPGVDRQLAVLVGRLQLNVDGRTPVEITPASPPVAFPGDVATTAEPLDTPVLDLNVMTRRGQFAARMVRHHFAQAATITLNAALSLLIPEPASTQRDVMMFHGPAKVPVASGSLIKIEIDPA
jgi:environmental stress-induced protein Ves